MSYSGGLIGNDRIWKLISTIAAQASEYGNMLTGLTSHSAEARRNTIRVSAKHAITGRSHALESSEVTLLRGLYQEAKAPFVASCQYRQTLAVEHYCHWESLH
jgi:hypothetical protein